MMTRKFMIFVLIFLFVISFSIFASDYQMKIDFSKKDKEISPLLYGLFFEDINYAADGGLYANLIQNSSFEFENAYTKDKMYSWEIISTNKEEIITSIESIKLINENNPNYLKISINSDQDQRVQLVNKGFDGIYVIQDDSYKVSLYLQNENFNGGIEIFLQDEKGKVIGKGAFDKPLTNEWGKYEIILTPCKTTESARLVINLKGKGTLLLDMITMFPERSWNGILRNDLVKLMKDFQPRFLRFPGGCIVEGDSFENIYRWKDTIGEPVSRKMNYNLWYSREFPYYFQSYGLGFYEYFLLSDYLNAEPVPTVNCGMTCQARGGGPLALDQTYQFVQDAIDLIEFANLSTDSEWGKVRRELGHSQPFDLNFVGIGNEQWGWAYFNKYSLFHDSLKAHFPEINLIAGVGPSPDDALYHEAMNWITDLPQEEKPDYIDEHIYRSPEWFYTNIHRYDNYDRNMPKVFIGELAAHNDKMSNNLQSALAEAAFLTAIEKNSDVVKMVSYAPLFAKIGYNQWQPNFVWFTDTDAIPTVNYQVWKLFSRNLGDYVVESSLAKQRETPYSITGKIGLGSRRNVIFENLIILKEKNQVIAERFSEPLDKTMKFTIINGNFEILENKLLSSHQTLGFSCIQLNEFFMDDSKDYSISVDFKITQRLGEAVVYLGLKDKNNYLLLHLANEGSYLELVSDEISYQMTPYNYFPLAINQAYRIFIDITGNSIKIEMAQLNDSKINNKELLFDVSIRPNLGPLYQVVNYDEQSGDIIIKVVNSSQEDLKTNITISGVDYIYPKGLITIISGNLNDENTLSNPNKIIPKTKQIEVSKDFDYQIEKNSVSVLRLKTKAEDFVKPKTITIDSTKSKIGVNDTLRIEITNCLMENGEVCELGEALIWFETDNPELVDFDYDITTGYNSLISLHNLENMKSDSFKVWAKVRINGYEIKSNSLTFEVKDDRN
jgi:alpha-L-arabinofuranosidase